MTSANSASGWAASLWWPGDHRAGDVMSDGALISALVAVEQAWLDALVLEGVAPAEARIDLADVAASLDEGAVAVAAEAGGNPVIDVVKQLRVLLQEVGASATAHWLHRGLTSQDVLDTAILMCARDAIRAVRGDLRAQARLLVALAEQHRDSVMIARTLTQPAVPTTFGAKASGWLHGLIDADDQLAALRWPLQLGGAAGTLAAIVELAGPGGTRNLRANLAQALDLEPVAPWHTRRTPITRLGDSVVTTTDALGCVANDVLALGRPEIGELRDGSAGASSAMPHKANPTLAVLVRRTALAAPQLGATLHLAAAEQVDERADGGWHVEWQTLGLLLRRSVVAASQSTDLLRGLMIDTDRMADRVAEFDGDIHAEQRAIADLAGSSPAATYLGLTGGLIDEAIARAAAHPFTDTNEEDLE